MARRSAGLFSGFGPEALTAMAISLPMRANALDMRSQRANIVALRVSKMRPIRAHSGVARVAAQLAPGCSTPRGWRDQRLRLRAAVAAESGRGARPCAASQNGDIETPRFSSKGMR